MRRPPLVFLIACLGLPLLAGCAGREAVRIVVVDGATRAPVPGAAVKARPLEFFIPVEPYPTLDPFPEHGSEAITDESGAALLSLPGGSPVQLVVLAPGYPVYRSILEPGRGGPADWTPAEPTLERFAEGPYLDVSIESVEE